MSIYVNIHVHGSLISLSWIHYYYHLSHPNNHYKKSIIVTLIVRVIEYCWSCVNIVNITSILLSYHFDCYYLLY